MIGWLRRKAQRLGRYRFFPGHSSRTGSTRGEAVAREAIQLLREAELDFQRCGQPVLSRTYGHRAAQLERELTGG